MSNMAEISRLSEMTTQLPIEWYLDPTILEIEKRILFDQGPGYVGHEVMVPQVGDYYVPEWMNNAKVLVRNSHGVELLSNVCRHRQALLLQGRSNTKSIVCPVHRWTYALDGKLLGAPHFERNPCLNLTKSPLKNWNGMLFNGKRDVSNDMKDLSVLRDFDFSGYVLDRVQTNHYACNWKTFIEVYLEDYHVEPFHPGLSGFVDTNKLEWEFGEWYSVQTVAIDNTRFENAGSPVYAKWHEQVLQYTNGNLPKHGAIWLLYYPNIMVEWYPHTLVISSIWPTGVDSCSNVVEFYYPEEIALFERDFVAAEQAAYQETAEEDDEICKLMTAGRRALFEQGINETGPYQIPMEAGLEQFHQFLQQKIRHYV